MGLCRDRNGYAIIGATSGREPGRFDSWGGRENSTRGAGVRSQGNDRPDSPTGGAGARFMWADHIPSSALSHVASFNKKI